MTNHDLAPEIFKPLYLDQILPFAGNDVTEIITNKILKALPSDGITFGITEGLRSDPVPTFRIAN